MAVQSSSQGLVVAKAAVDIAAPDDVVVLDVVVDEEVEVVSLERVVVLGSSLTSGMGRLEPTRRFKGCRCRVRWGHRCMLGVRMRMIGSWSWLSLYWLW